MQARSNSLRGIVNGIDYAEYNPETDAMIAMNYNAKTFRKEKVKNKDSSSGRTGTGSESEGYDAWCGIAPDRSERF